jgi:1-acyl-sn-glycerol-3-phosphate acyltransferase
MYVLGEKVFPMMTWPFQQKIQRWITWCLLTLMMRVTVEGLENVPQSGPYIMIWNHLHISDGMLLWSRVPSPTLFVATAKFENRNRLVHAYLCGTGAILIREGGTGHRSIKQVLSALREGTPVAIAPEGRISTTGALCHAEPGVASLVCHSQAKVVPVAIWGQHKAHEAWRKFRRPRVTIRFGVPQTHPPVAPSAPNLRDLTTTIMTGLARILPPPYRGVYSDCEERERSICG